MNRPRVHLICNAHLDPVWQCREGLVVELDTYESPVAVIGIDERRTRQAVDRLRLGPLIGDQHRDVDLAAEGLAIHLHHQVDIVLQVGITSA